MGTSPVLRDRRESVEVRGRYNYATSLALGMGNVSRFALVGVVSDGFSGAAISTNDEDIDATVDPEHMRHVVDSDSSQSLVVHDVLKGRSIVVQGPSGTGKSQTIANIIAGAIAEKKRVLFVAEKLAALEVVKRRLDQVRLGAACLELHSNKANKRALLEELRLTWNLSPLAEEDSGPIVRQLTERRDLLNAHALRLHQELLPSKLTPYEVFGNLVRLRREGHVKAHIRLDSPIEWAWDRVGENQKLLQDLFDRVRTMGVPDQHAWAGVENETLLPNDRDRLIREMADLANKLEDWRQRAVELTGMLDLTFSDSLDAPQAAIDQAKILLAAPHFGSDALADASWETPAGPEGLIEDSGGCMSCTELVTSSRPSRHLNSLGGRRDKNCRVFLATSSSARNCL